MPYRDLRDDIAELDKRDLLQVVDAPVCKDTELVPLVRSQFRGLPEAERRALWSSRSRTSGVEISMRPSYWARWVARARSMRRPLASKRTGPGRAGLNSAFRR